MIQRHWVSTHFKLWILTCITGLLLTGSKGQVTEWGSWSGYTECSRTCGSGVQVRSRVCLVRRQVDGACQGDNTQARSCNTEPCPAGTVDFRTAQCSSFNGVPIKVNDVTKEFSWRPYFDASRPCALVCRSNKGDVMTLRETVADGTSCDHIDTMGVCVGGVCKNIGCDRVLGSTVNEDNCLVCGGQDKKCHTEEGSTLNVDFTNGEWKEVVTFPLEATRLAITILSTPPSALELRSDDGQSIELTQLMSGSSKAAVEFAGTRFIYHTEEDESKFTARGPINQTLYLKLLFNRQNPLVQYRYSIPRSRYIEADAQDRYAWLHGSWSLCSANCGVGFQLRAVRCIDRVTGQYVNQTLCPSDEVPISNQTCNNGPCYISVEDRFKWMADHFDECSVECGLGEQMQIYVCTETGLEGSSSVVEDEMCTKHIGEKPVFKRACVGEEEDCPNNMTEDTALISMDCKISSFGCCPDQVTHAKGDNFYGCPADTFSNINLCELPHVKGLCASQYVVRWHYDKDKRKCQRFWDGGCQTNGNSFEDDVTCITRCMPELKENGCKTSTFGCCADGVTYAKGNNKQGCPPFTGLCSESRYGCCHDGVTAAKGENNKGCREEHRLVGGCAGTRYGCCADGVTSARGENRYGCPSTCVASAYGCCSDGVTSASGPNKQGCPEEEKNIVLGGCESTRYGCCNDGVTAARDEQKLNCPGFDPAYCALPKDAGSCGNFTLKWFFDTKYGSCRQFYYGGCKGNQNRFPTREDCEYHCVNVEGPGACRLPSVVGPCKSYQTKYFFNLEKKKCEQFTYGGCIGNTNKFNTLEDCEASCSQRGRPSACAKLPCKNGFSCQDSADGSYTCSCHSDWGRNCDHIPDYWCLSNAECGQGLKCVHQRKCQDGLCENLARCTAAARVFKCDSSVCSANEDCVNDDSISRGYFCQPKTSYRRSSSVHLGCRLSEFGCCPDSQSPASGPNQQGCPVRCENSRYGCCADGRTPAKGYDYEGCDVEGSGDMPCERKRYGCCDDGVTAATGPRGRGCGETTDSEDRVQQTTQPSVKQTGETVFVKCQAPLVIKLCTKYEVKWRYNYTNQVCERFWWGGCQDNGNVFNDNKTCHSECKKATENTDTDFMNICDMPSYTGPCRAYINRYYYNPRERSCLQFVYGGCQGNENNFETIERCQQECMGTVVSGTDNVRTTPRPTPVTVPIQANRETLSLSGESTVREDGDIRLTCTSQGLPNVRLRWYFNGEDVQQNSNARVRQQTSGYSHDLELRIPYAKPSSSGVYVCRSSTGKQERIDVTVVPAAPRTPPPTSDTSEERSLIMYGEFNFNVGATIDISCRATGPERPTDMDWYFNGRPLNAYSYVSINTYPDPSSRNALLSNVTIRNAGKRNEGTYVCRSRPYADRRLKMIRINEVIGPVATSPPVQESTTPTGDSTAICLMEAVTGVCRANINRWYYNHKEGTCSPFVYGGCGGNGNNFKTADECNNFCSAQEICMKQKDVGNCRAAMPRFYFDSKAGQCYSFLYGGCGGNLNNFESLSACDRRCHQYKRSTATQVIVVQSTGEGARAEEDACQMLPAKGTCKANSIKWFYSPARNRCESFQYSGCGGNNNRFDSQESCMQKCYKEPASNRRPTTPESNVIPSVESNVCVLKKDQGGCNNWTILWYYDTNKAACMRFYYGGCTGNGNRFNNKEECENKCIRGAVAPSTPRPDSCRYSAYGCCNDGITRAVDRERSNCYESNTSLEENQRLVSVKVGTQASLHCPYTGSEVFWFKDINRLYSSPLYDILPNGTLIFNQVTEDVAGIYSCRVKDVYAVGRIQRFKVDIHVPVHIMPGPIRMAFKPGVRAVLTCHATGTPPPRVSWEYRGRVLSSGRHHQIFGNGTLVVDSIQPEDAGDYTCSAENGVNSPSRRKIQVQIRDPVEVTIQKHKHTYSEGDTITLVCKGAGYPAPTLEWKKDGKVLTSDNNTRVSNGDLTILSASIEDSGTYKCIANGSTEKAVEDVTTIQIQLQSPSTKCVDTRKVQDCRRYVLRHMCGIHIFANMCCKSCRDAGKL